MAQFLVRSFSDPRGYVEYNTPMGGLLPRTPQESYVPWAITADNKVVYAKTGEHASWRGGSGATRLKPYDTFTSQDRRRHCESALGMIALNNRYFTENAVNAVSSAIKVYLTKQFWADQNKTVKCIYDEIGHYFFTSGGKGFGRISEADKKGLKPEQVWQEILKTLTGGRLDQVMAIHDAVGRKILPKLGGSELKIYNDWGPILRQDWFDDKDKRGRVDTPAQRNKEVQPTLAGGISNRSGMSVPTVAINRNRGVDMYMRDAKRTREPEADSYYDDVDVRNLLFGAGISGTTGSLLQAALAFGKLGKGEPLKQYVMAIVGYLVGGGMHSYHETMAVAQKAGVVYEPGAFQKSLPMTFVNSSDFQRWNETFYDIVTLGATHWRHNAGTLPSHLNTQLKSAPVNP